MTSIPPEPQSPPPAAPPPSSDANTMAMLAHLLGIFTGFVGSLIIWLVKKEVPFVEQQAKEALNFQITMAIAVLACVVVLFLPMIFLPFLACLFWLVIMGLWVANLVLCILGAMKAKDGVAYRYPFALRLIK